MLCGLRRCIYIILMIQECIHGSRLNRRMEFGRDAAPILEGVKGDLSSTPESGSPRLGRAGGSGHLSEQSGSPFQATELIGEFGDSNGSPGYKNGKLLIQWQHAITRVTSLNRKVGAFKDGAELLKYRAEWNAMIEEFAAANTLVDRIIEDIIPDPSQEIDLLKIQMTKPAFELGAFYKKDFLPFFQQQLLEKISKITEITGSLDGPQAEASSPLKLDLKTLKECLHTNWPEGKMEDMKIRFVAAVLSAVEISSKYDLIGEEEVKRFFGDEETIKIVGKHLVDLYGEKYPNFFNSANFKPNIDYFRRDTRTSHLHSCLSILDRPTQGKIVYTSIQTAFATAGVENKAASEGHLMFTSACQEFLDDSFIKEFQWKKSSGNTEIQLALNPKLEIVYSKLAKVFTQMPAGIDQLEFLTSFYFLDFLITYNANNIENLIKYEGFKEEYALIKHGLQIHELRNVYFSKGRQMVSNPLIGFTAPKTSMDKIMIAVKEARVEEYSQSLTEVQSDAHIKTWRTHDIVSSILGQFTISRIGLITQDEFKKNEWLQDIGRVSSDALTSSTSESHENNVHLNHHQGSPKREAGTNDAGDQIQPVSSFGTGAANVLSTGVGAAKTVLDRGAGGAKFVLGRGAGVLGHGLGGVKFVVGHGVGAAQSVWSHANHVLGSEVRTEPTVLAAQVEEKLHISDTQVAEEAPILGTKVGPETPASSNVVGTEPAVFGTVSRVAKSPLNMVSHMRTKQK
ncbi:hypothetical protein Pst134EA_011281 [Puccinia striiformis f. sp. tritici]|uniref:hypothetical protein n=1 Tax=Puccinia striiformis f. sp. tritici TaxID=168172 RepID=UPI002007A803|nr:hypothetical protein Pst134EA_011281 [Puccinia striiformis f. sp. tritici]KAH9467646.1 hypothetical protein Pst134EA_011281 [Puccinia striiformis f. sp. tritici]